MLGGEQKKSEEQEKGDDNEIANEEHGIEMSDDFEGETHDVEKSGESSDEDGESGDESENLKQEMGDVDGADETLDKKLWADSDEEDNNDKVLYCLYQIMKFKHMKNYDINRSVLQLSL